jgi:hypothetical protein
MMAKDSIWGDGRGFSKKDRLLERRAKRIARKAIAAEGKKSKRRKNGWSDVCERVLLDNQALLFAFVEGELYNPNNVQIDWEWNAHARNAKREMDTLYIFFKVGRPKLQAEIDRLSMQAYNIYKKVHGHEMFEPPLSGGSAAMKPTPPAARKLYRKVWKLQEKLDVATTDALCRIMKVRQSMWT